MIQLAHQRSTVLPLIAVLGMLPLQAARTTDLPAPSTQASLRCEAHAAIVDRTPLNAQTYAIIQARSLELPETLYEHAPINGGRYWVRSDFGDGAQVSPYAHIGCFADPRAAIAWACLTDRDYVRRRGGCHWQIRGAPVALPKYGCVSLAYMLREPILYCAPGSSPPITPLQ